MTFTAQQIFDISGAHLLKQNAKSCAQLRETDPPGHAQCVYRGEYGRRCAIGCLIPDELYRPEFEGQQADESTIRDVLISAGIDARAHRELLIDLQMVHDQQDVSTWADGLLEIAHIHQLDARVVNTVDRPQELA